jgi:predicted RNase H-like HicB family nuclease
LTGNGADMRDKGVANHMKNTSIIPLADGPITVVFQHDGPYWIATALEFDIIGTGKTRQESLSQLQELVSLYLFEVIQEPDKHNIFNPSESELWALADKVKYNVLISLKLTKKTESESKMMLRDVRPFRNSIKEFNLSPACIS